MSRFQGDVYGLPKANFNPVITNYLPHPDGRAAKVCPAGQNYHHSGLSGAVLPFKVFDPRVEMTPPVDDKTLNTRVDEVIKHRAYSAKSIPAPDHPWRRYPAALTAGGGQLPSA